MTQTKDELENWYKSRDPWGYSRSADDYIRKRHITHVANLYAGDSDTSLDLGCGEGWITKHLPGRLFGIELSDKAASRLPANIKRIYKPQGGYDLVLASGVLYDQYEYKKLRDWIEGHATNVVLTCHYDNAGIAHDLFDKPQIFYAEFPYREGKQVLRVYSFA